MSLSIVGLLAVTFIQPRHAPRLILPRTSLLSVATRHNTFNPHLLSAVAQELPTTLGHFGCPKPPVVVITAQSWVAQGYGNHVVAGSSSFR